MQDNKPFTQMIQRLNRTGVRYFDMQKRSNEVRSSAWFNKIANGDHVSPPPPETLSGLAQLFETTPEAVAEMVAEEWYGIRRDIPLSERVQVLAPALIDLGEDDAELVKRLIYRLPKSA